MKNQEYLVQEYINGYNAFDIKMMLSVLHNDVVFENVINDEVTLSLEGLDAFREQAEKATKLFVKRNQSIREIQHTGDTIVIEVEYSAILAVDLSEDIKAGDQMNIKGKSTFSFKENKIIKIIDIS